MYGFCIILVLKGIMTFQSQRVHAFCWTKIQTLIKTKWNRKCKTLHTALERQTLSFSSCKNHELKVKLANEKRVHFLYERIFFEICVLSQCTVHWMNVPNIYTSTIQKTLLHTLLLLTFKIVKNLQWILKGLHIYP